MKMFITLKSMTRAAQLLFDLPPSACRWPSKRDLDDPLFVWCGQQVEGAGPYCSKHREGSIGTGEDTAALDEDIVMDGARYRTVVARGRNLGDRRQWRVVPLGAGKPRRRLPGHGKAERYPTTGKDDEAHHARALRAADAGDGHLPGVVGS
jgi:hypothetical protein